MQETKKGRRNSMRVPCGLRVQVLTQDGPIDAEVMNISQKGLFLRPDANTPTDAIRLTANLPAAVPLTIVLHFQGEPQATRARATVAWKSDLGVGLSFLDPPERLREFVSDLQEESSPSSVLSQIAAGRVEVD